MVPDVLHIKPNVLSKAKKFLQGYGPKYPDGKYMTVTQDRTDASGPHSLQSNQAKDVNVNQKKAFESRAQVIMERLMPVNLRGVIASARSTIQDWIADNNHTTDMIPTDDLRQKLNRAIQMRYPITFIPDETIRITQAQHGGNILWTGKAGTHPQRQHIVEVVMRDRAAPERVEYLLDRNLSMLNSMLQHEFTHMQQMHKNPVSGTNLLVRPNRAITAPPGMKVARSLARRPSDTPRARYLAQPEEISAHARGAAELLKNPATDVEGHMEIAKYLILGRNHPAFKRFVKHLIQYMNNDARAVNQAIMAAERRMRK